MKKYNFLISLLMVLSLTLAACSGEDTEGTGNTVSDETAELAYEPEEIDPDKDVCEICGMAIADDQHAAQIVLKNDRTVKFDDIGDLYVWLDENGIDDVGDKFVRDFNTKEWVQLDHASFVYDEEISTPMGYGVITFKESDDAEKYIEDNGFGVFLHATELNDHEWSMMMDHDEHGDHDHGDDHVFHTEGFDMHMTELEDVTVGGETRLEVNIELFDAALQGANVRYEIWQESDRDKTSWVDAEEMEEGNYIADHQFEEAGTYHIQIHVENEDDLHEHKKYEVGVKD